MDWLDRVNPCVRVVGSGAVPPGWVEALRSIYDHELVIAERGATRVDIEGETIMLDAEGYLIVPPGRAHVSADASGGGGVRRWVHFSWTPPGPGPDVPILTYAPAPVQSDLVVPSPTWVPRRIMHGRLRHPERVVDLHEELLGRFNRGTSHDRRTARAIALEILIEALDPAQDDAATHRPDADRLAQAARERLEGLAREPMRSAPRIREALEALGCSYEHAARQFRRAYGVAPGHYVNALRLERARRLLRDSDLGIAEIAYRVGFESASYFSRLFRRRTGRTPREEKRRLRKR